MSAATYRLRKRLRKVEARPPDYQGTVLELVQALVPSRESKVGG